MSRSSAVLLILALSCLAETESFLLQSVVTEAGDRSPSYIRTDSRRYNFFDNILSKAFENDASLSKSDKTTGQIDESGYDEEEEMNPRMKAWTATQEQWREKMLTKEVPTLLGTIAYMDFYLTGVPNKDPSNDLFGSKVNISSRNRKVGQMLPEKPTVSSVGIEFLADGKCCCKTDSGFTELNSEGEWKLSDNGDQVRFRIPVAGYKRTIETKGTISKVYWSKEEEKTSQTSTTYSIPSGWMYGEASISTSSSRNNVVNVEWDDGVLKVEQPMGLLGAGSRMVPCGTFTATVKGEDKESDNPSTQKGGVL